MKRLIVRRFGYDSAHGAKRDWFYPTKDEHHLINNRQQSGRRRGRGGQRQNGGGGRGPEMGNRIDNRARGNAPQLLEKYKTLARDAQQAGDRVLAEYYLQFADHYFRVIAENRARFEEANPRARQERLEAEEGYDGEDGDEGEGDEFDVPREARPQQPQRQYREERNDRGGNERQDRGNRDGNDRGGNRNERYSRDDRPRDDRDEPRAQYEDRPRRDDRPVRESRPERDERPREDRAPREERAPRERAPLRARANGNGAHHADEGDSTLPFDALPPSISIPSSMEPVAGVEGEPIAAPKKRGRPKKVVAEAATEE